jgi:DNA-binding CsgD family transcriptional regulator/tetratricopeptide (TPR) repeat protein
MDRLDEEHDNLRLAIDWALQAGGDTALRLSGALSWFWWGRYHSEGRRWLSRALTASSPDRTAARMKALHAAGFLAQHQRDSGEARTLLEESLAIARELDDRWMVAWTLHGLGRVAYFDNDPQTARSLGEHSLAVAHEVGDPWLIAWAHHLLGLAAYIAADDATARAHYEQSLAIRRKLEFDEGVAILLGLLGLVALRQGDLGQAHALFREGLILVQGLLGPWGSAMLLAALSHIAAACGQPLRAVRLGAAATAFGESYHTPLIPLFEPPLAEGLARARRALGEAVYLQAWNEGGAMSVDEAVAEALKVEVPAAPAQGTPEPGRGAHGTLGKLTTTELRVLRLLASGRTTKEIAGELIVAVSTADRHITHIYDKLGVHNRAEATALAVKHGLI